MILVEVCKDLQKIQSIIEGLMKYDSVNKNKNDAQATHKRQKYRLQFTEYIMKGVKERYAHQIYLLYKGDEKLIGKDSTNGLTVKMKRDAYSYGI